MNTGGGGGGGYLNNCATESSNNEFATIKAFHDLFNIYFIFPECIATPSTVGRRLGLLYKIQNKQGLLLPKFYSC
jgi:hypothetical protein